MKQIVILGFLMFGVASCRDTFKSDASGVFEADEVIVSAEQNGKILAFPIQEGDVLIKNTGVGQIDVSNDKLRAEQVKASIAALQKKTNDPEAQVQFTKRQLAVQQAQLQQQLNEKHRIENLYKADAATRKQLDDMNAAIDQLKKQIQVTQQQIQLSLSNINTQNRSILSEQNPLEKSVAQINNQISKGQIVCPISGTVLSKYAFEGEMATVGKALFKIANLDTLTLRAYISGEQLTQIKLGQTVDVLIDQGKKEFKNYKGQISWIAAKAEFTPKTIQTKNERASLVYAIKVRVKNDGYLKLGMYGELRLPVAEKS